MSFLQSPTLPVPVRGSGKRGARFWERVSWRMACAATVTVIAASGTIGIAPKSTVHGAAVRCASAAPAADAGVRVGRAFVSTAYQALSSDRERLAGLGPLRASQALSVVAELHSSYMASIGGWSDGDPNGGILERVRAAGLNATYAGQNVVTAFGADLPSAILKGEAFFAQEADGGGPHWDNITNPNHHYVGIGISVTGAEGAYTIYLTQVFSDVGGCAPSTVLPDITAASSTTDLRVGQIVHPTTDALQLRSEPHGMSLGILTPKDRLKVIETQQGWAHVKVLDSGIFGWVFSEFVGPA